MAVNPLCPTELEIINIYSFNDFDFPNVLTPNGDGANDVFDLEAYFKTCNAYEIMYFDRWGNGYIDIKKMKSRFQENHLTVLT